MVGQVGRRAGVWIIGWMDTCVGKARSRLRQRAPCRVQWTRVFIPYPQFSLNNVTSRTRNNEAGGLGAAGAGFYFHPG
jgi:hypothetical protein